MGAKIGKKGYYCSMEYERTTLNTETTDIEVIRVPYGEFSTYTLNRLKMLLSNEQITLCAYNPSKEVYEVMGKDTLDHLGSLKETTRQLDSLPWLKVSP